MEVNKYDLGKGVEAMRAVVRLLTGWADDLEAAAQSGKIPPYASGPPANPMPPLSPVPGSYPPADPAPPQEPAPVPESAPATATDSVPANAPPPALPTYEEVLTVLSKLCAAGMSPQVQELIVGYGAMCLSEVPAEKYGELLEAARRLAEEGKVDLTAGDGGG